MLLFHDIPIALLFFRYKIPNVLNYYDNLIHAIVCHQNYFETICVTFVTHQN